MRTVWKVELVIQEIQTVMLPERYEIISLMVQHGTPCLWAIVNPEHPKYGVRILIHGTGHPISDDAGEFLGSFMLTDGGFIGHVWKGLV